MDPATAPLVFLGRLERCKGAHTAIDVARRLGRRLLIAGTVSPLPAERAYFEREVAPQIDGSLVRYLGPVDDVQKNALLGAAAALLLPIEWEEPFPGGAARGLRSAGHPSSRSGGAACPRESSTGKTGFVCDTGEEMAEFVNQLDRIDRLRCRDEAERRFSDVAIVDAYERLYHEMTAR